MAVTPDGYLDSSLARGAAAAARRLRPMCADWPDDRFGDLAHAAALTRLKDDVPPDVYEAMRSRYAEQRDADLARLRGPSD